MSQTSTPRNAKKRPKNNIPKLENRISTETSMAKNTCNVPRMPPLYPNGNQFYKFFYTYIQKIINIYLIRKDYFSRILNFKKKKKNK